MSDQIMIPPVMADDESSRKSMDVDPSASASASTPSDLTAKPTQTSLSPLLAQIGIDPVTGTETTLSLFAFTAENEDELSFPANELIRIVEKDQEYNDGWYRGKNQKGEEGLFPASYVLPTGADPKPYLEMQQAPQPLNIGPGSKQAGTPSHNNVVHPESSVPMGLGIGGVATSGAEGTPRPGSPAKSLNRARSSDSLQSADSGAIQIPLPAADTAPREDGVEGDKDDGLVETRELASKGQIQGPHAQASELVSPAERAAVRMDMADESAGPSSVGAGTIAAATAGVTGLVGGVAGLAIVSSTKQDQNQDQDRERRKDRDATPMPEDGDRTITEKDELDREVSSVGHGDDTLEMDEHEPADGPDVAADNNNIRARLAEQARLENEKKEKKLADEVEAEREAEARKRAASDASIGFASPGPSAVKNVTESTPVDLPRKQSNGGQRVSGVRMSGGVPHGLVYSDESDSEDEGSVVGGLGSPKRGTNRRLGWEDEDEQAAKGFGGFARFGAFGAGKMGEQGGRLEQIQEKNKVEPVSESGNGLEPPAAIVAPVAVRPIDTRAIERVESAPTEPTTLQAPIENTPRAFVQPAVDPREESPMGTPVVQLNDDRFQSPPAPVFRRQSSGLSNLSREMPAVAAATKSASPVPQQQPPMLNRKYSEELAAPRSGAVTPKDASRLSEAGSGFSGGNPHEWGVTEVVEWARSRGFDDAICEKFAGESSKAVRSPRL